MAKLRITYTKSAIGYSKDQKDTVRSLGLRKLNSTAIHNDTPAIRGMAFKVRHLVTVEELADDQPAKAARARAAKPVVTKPAAAVEPEAKPAAKPAAAVEPETKPAAKPAAAVEPEAKVAEVPTVEATGEPGTADDLTLIEGIGPKIASVLNAEGITTFAQLAATDADRLSQILKDANLRLSNAETWPEQAALAAAGKWDEFNALLDQLKGGRRV